MITLRKRVLNNRPVSGLQTSKEGEECTGNEKIENQGIDESMNHKHFYAACFIVLFVLTSVFKSKMFQSEAEKEYNNWLQVKSESYNRTCLGWREYREYIEKSFALLPEAPNCSTISTFYERYGNYPGALTMRRNIRRDPDHFYIERVGPNKHGPEHPLQSREKDYNTLWKKANENRTLPPNIEMLVYVYDKPRARSDLGVPTFVVSGEFPVGANDPKEYVGYLPFPSHFFVTREPPPKGSDKDFLSRIPKLFYRGRFSEHCWKRFNENSTITKDPHCKQTARFKLAYATRRVEDEDVLDVKLTVSHLTKAPEIREVLSRDYNITTNTEFEKFSLKDYRYSLGVSGNGWAGATMMNSMLFGGVPLFVEDDTIDEENYTRRLGELYFTLLRPGKDLVVVDYDSIASTVRELNVDPDRASEIAANAVEFREKYLGMDCALDAIELLAWNHYKYANSGCPNAFSFV